MPYNGSSVVDYINSTGGDSSFAARKKLAEENNIANYTGTAEQNTSLLSTLKNKSSSSPAALTANNNVGLTSDEMEKGTALPDPTTVVQNNNPGPTLNDKVSELAKTTLTGTQKAIEELKATQQKQIETEKAKAQTDVDSVKSEMNSIKNTTQLQDKLNEINNKFQVDDTIRKLTDVNTKLVQAQEALNVGLIYEQGRPARQQLVSGRMNTLKAQGLATIGALQGIAAVYQNNINLAKAYATQTLDAIKDDNNRSLDALSTLLDLANNKLVDLTKEERSTVDERIKLISDQSDKLEKDKESIQQMMLDYPDEFLKSGVSLLDSKEEALKKILPKLAATARLKLAKSLSNGNTTKLDTPENKNSLLQFRSNALKKIKDGTLGKTMDEVYQDAILAFGDVLSISYIDDVFPEEAKKANTLDKDIDYTKRLQNEAWKKYFDADGNVLPGYNVSVVDGKPNITAAEGYKLKDGVAVQKGESWWSRIFN